MLKANTPPQTQLNPLNDPNIEAQKRKKEEEFLDRNNNPNEIHK